MPDLDDQTQLEHENENTIVDRREGRPLVGVGAVLFTADREQVLLVQRDSPPAEGCWSVPGGLVERGETLRLACEREVFEETGLRPDLRQEVIVIERIIKSTAATNVIDYHFLIVDFWGVVRGDTKPKAGSDVCAARWVRIPEVEWLQTTHSLAEVIERAHRLATGREPKTPLFKLAVD